MEAEQSEEGIKGRTVGELGNFVVLVPPGKHFPTFCKRVMTEESKIRCGNYEALFEVFFVHDVAFEKGVFFLVCGDEETEDFDDFLGFGETVGLFVQFSLDGKFLFLPLLTVLNRDQLADRFYTLLQVLHFKLKCFVELA